MLGIIYLAPSLFPYYTTHLCGTQQIGKINLHSAIDFAFA